MLTLDSETKLFRSTCIELGCCKDAIDWMALIKDESTINELLEKYSKDTLTTQGWTAWAIKFLGTILDRQVRIGFLNSIREPMVAFNIYLEFDDITDEEDNLLEAKFKGKLPVAEKELQAGVIKRKKESGKNVGN